MCGINGIFAYANYAPLVDISELESSRDSMFARGPDGCGTWISQNGRIGFGHRRLAIIELSELGAQPMHSADGQLSITFNGEIYNHNELRTELEANGFKFRGHSDTEVLLCLYRHLGPKMVEHLRGMFAFALWDNLGKKLILARDPYGIKPIYYSNTNGVFRFASQVKSLLAGQAVDKSIDPAGLVSFLMWGSISEPFTLHEKIHCLPAGHILEINHDGFMQPYQYWNIDKAINNSLAWSEEISESLAFETGINAIRDSVKAHMVADVPIGTFLSAGLDSATITGLAQELANEPVLAITLAFEEFKGKALDEAPIASEIAKLLGVNHRVITTEMAEVENELSTFLNAMDQPSIDGINTWLVSKAAKSAGLKVVLSGLGGDEMLGGYNTFEKIPIILNRYKKYNSSPFANHLFFNTHHFISSHFKRLSPNNSDILNMSRNLTSAYQLERGLFMPWELHKLIDNDLVQAGITKLAEIGSAQSVVDVDNEFGKLVAIESTKYMKNQLLRDTDWIGMAHSLEIRVPLVDHLLLTKLVGLAARQKIGHKKEILPRSLSATLGEHILRRPKTGFTIPIWRWLNNSRNFSSWKKNKYLTHSNIIPNKRWAYCILEQSPSVNSYLK